jgi:hypothetical protein
MYGEDRTTIVDRREMLKVKIKSLAEESRIIRNEERKSNGVLRNELHSHRVIVVRNAARHTHIAYGLIKGRRLDQIEKTDRRINWDSVRKMIKQYGPVNFTEPVEMKKAA